jgi:hypothetical protein
MQEDLSNYYVKKCVPPLFECQSRYAIPNGYSGSKCVRDTDCYPCLKCVFPQDTDSLFAQYSDLIPTSGICN